MPPVLQSRQGSRSFPFRPVTSPASITKHAHSRALLCGWRQAAGPAARLHAGMHGHPPLPPRRATHTPPPAAQPALARSESEPGGPGRSAAKALAPSLCSARCALPAQCPRHSTHRAIASGFQQLRLALPTRQPLCRQQLPRGVHLNAWRQRPWPATPQPCSLGVSTPATPFSRRPAWHNSCQAVFPAALAHASPSPPPP